MHKIPLQNLEAEDRTIQSMDDKFWEAAKRLTLLGMLSETSLMHRGRKQGPRHFPVAHHQELSIERSNYLQFLLGVRPHRNALMQLRKRPTMPHLSSFKSSFSWSHQMLQHIRIHNFGLPLTFKEAIRLPKYEIPRDKAELGKVQDGVSRKMIN